MRLDRFINVLYNIVIDEWITRNKLSEAEMTEYTIQTKEGAKITVVQNGTWVNTEIKGRRVIAKVFDKGSSFGISNGRVSKLSVYKPGTTGNGFDDMEYNYDRGMDFSEIDEDILAEIVWELEHLPVSE